MRQLIRSYERLAGIYAKKSGLRLLIGGTGFSTDIKKHIVLADIPEELVKKYGDPALTGLVHECGHVEHTEFRTRAEKKADPIRSRYETLTQNLEDVRIHHLNSKEYPGWPFLNKNGLSFMRDEVLVPHMKAGHIDAIGMLAIGIHFRESGVGTEWLPNEINQLVDETRDIWHGVEWLPREEGYGQDKEIAELILERLKDLTQPQPTPDKGEKGDDESGDDSEQEGQEEEKDEEQNGSGESEGEQDPEDDDDEIEGEQEEEDEEEDLEKEEDENDEEDPTEGDEEPSDPEGSDGLGDGEDELDGDEPDDKEGGVQDDAGDDGEETEETPLQKLAKQCLEADDENRSEEDPTSDLMEALHKVIQAAVEEFVVDNDKHIAHPDIIARDVEEQCPNPFKDPLVKESMDRHYGGDAIAFLEEEFTQISDDVDQQVLRLKARILPLLMAEKRSAYLHAQEEGKLDQGRLWRIKHGDSKVKMKKVEGRKMHTAMSILCDLSGSMMGDKINMLRPTLLVIADTLFALKVPFEILGFTDIYGDSVTNKLVPEWRSASPRIYNRIEPLYHFILKSFDDNYLAARKLLPLLRTYNSNFDNESVVWAARRLGERKEQRKILMVLSDGNPLSGYSDTYMLRRDLKERIVQIEASGIETIGVGIIDDAPKDFYPSFVLIKKIDEISTQIYSALMEKLRTRGKGK